MNLRLVRSAAESLAEESGHTTPPVDVQGIAKRLGLAIVSEDLGEGVSGLLVTGPSGNFVVVQESDSTNRRRFTIAHEIGHFYLRHQFAPGEHVHVDRGHFVTPRGPSSSTGEYPKEIEANQFAASLLMPSRLLRAEIKHLGTENLFDYQVSELAEKFEVSEQAMTIRLSTLGLI